MQQQCQRDSKGKRRQRRNMRATVMFTHQAPRVLLRSRPGCKDGSLVKVAPASCGCGGTRRSALQETHKQHSFSMGLTTRGQVSKQTLWRPWILRCCGQIFYFFLPSVLFGTKPNPRCTYNSVSSLEGPSYLAAIAADITHIDSGASFLPRGLAKRSSLKTSAERTHPPGSDSEKIILIAVVLTLCVLKDSLRHLEKEALQGAGLSDGRGKRARKDRATFPEDWIAPNRTQPASLA